VNVPSKIVLRSLALDDVDAWTSLLADELHHDWTRTLVHDEVTQMDRRPHGAFIDGVLVGAIAIQVITAADEVWILDVTVAKSARRHGIGRALSSTWQKVRAGRAGFRFGSR
jgi:ribosomal protein S18 acetylase RimI-like enzyme